MARAFIDKGTLITLEDGSKVSIEDLKVGDKVQSYDIEREGFDIAHIGLNKQLPLPVENIEVETIPGENIVKLGFSGGSTLSVAGSSELLSADHLGPGRYELTDPHENNPDHQGSVLISVDSLVYIDSGEILDDVIIESIEDWKNSREMYAISVLGGNTVFANEVLVIVDRKYSDEELKAKELVAMDNDDLKVTNILNDDGVMEEA